MKFFKNIPSKTAYDEHSLLAGYRRTGDLVLLGRLCESYMPLVYGLCLKYFKDEEQSKDAVMQIFEQLIEKLRIHEVKNFKSWLYTMARNYCLMSIRASGKHETVSLEEEFMENDVLMHPDIEDNRERKLSIMEKCIEKLPPEQKETISLFYLKEKCYKEVSDITGYDMNKVKSYIQNGKRNLKICIEKTSED